jgi:DNA-binding MarR family transcriptional regulator
VSAASGALVGIALRSMAAGPAPVTIAQHRVLVLLDERGALSVTALAEHLGIDQSNASRHCSRLVDLGLVTRGRAAHDRRAVEVRLAPPGRQQVRAVQDARRREVAQALEELSDDQLDDVGRGFEQFARAANLILPGLSGAGDPALR